MKFDIHFHHHLNAEDAALLRRFNKGILTVEAKLDRIWEKLQIMNKEEQQLNTDIGELRELTTSGFQSISESVDKAAQRVIQRLEEKDIDLTDEISLLQEMKSTVRNSVSGAVEQLDRIAADSGGADTTNTQDATGTQSDQTSDLPANEATFDETAQASNQPFDPAPPEQAETTGFDDQERTPVPQV